MCVWGGERVVKKVSTCSSSKKHCCFLVDPFWVAGGAPGARLGWQGDRQVFGDRPSGLHCPHKPPSEVTWGGGRVGKYRG